MTSLTKVYKFQSILFLNGARELSESLKNALNKIASSIFIDEKLLNELIKEIQRALLQSDVNVKLVFSLTQAIKERAQKKILRKD